MTNIEKTVRLDRTKNTVRNMLAGILNKIVSILFPFLLRTVLIKVMGMEYAGLNGLFTSILEVLNLSELGMETAIVYCMYKPIACADDKAICALLKYYKKIYFYIGMVVLILGMSLLPFLPNFINGTYPENLNLYLLYMIYLFNSCGSYFFGGYRSSILIAHQRLDITQNISTIIKGIMYIVQILVIYKFKNYYLYVILLPIFTIIINLVTVYESKKIYPQFVCSGIISKETKKDLKVKISGLMITKLCAVTRNSFDSIFISAFIGLTVSAIYSNYYYIMKAIISLTNIIVSGVLAGVGNSIQTESREHNYKDLQRFNFMYLWICGICTSCLLCLYQPFMKLWMGKDNLLPMSSVVLICVYFYLLTMGDMQSVYYNAAGLWWYYRKCTIVEALMNLVLNYLLVHKWGLNGIIAGTLISLFLVNFLYSERLVFKYYFKNGKEKEFYLQQFSYAAVTATSCFCSYQLCLFVENLGMPDLLSIFTSGLICIIVTSFIFRMIYGKTKIFIDAKKWVNERIKHRIFKNYTKENI